MQLKRQYTVGELTQEIVSSAPAWAFHGTTWVKACESRKIMFEIDMTGYVQVLGVFIPPKCTCYPCRLHENGTIERLGE